MYNNLVQGNTESQTAPIFGGGAFCLITETFALIL